MTAIGLVVLCFSKLLYHASYRTEGLFMLTEFIGWCLMLAGVAIKIWEVMP